MRPFSRFIGTRLASAVVFAAIAGAASGHEAQNAYSIRNLVSDGSVPADNTGPNLIDGWGIAFNPCLRNGP